MAGPLLYLDDGPERVDRVIPLLRDRCKLPLCCFGPGALLLQQALQLLHAALGCGLLPLAAGLSLPQLVPEAGDCRLVSCHERCKLPLCCFGPGALLLQQALQLLHAALGCSPLPLAAGLGLPQLVPEARNLCLIGRTLRTLLQQALLALGSAGLQLPPEARKSCLIGRTLRTLLQQALLVLRGSPALSGLAGPCLMGSPVGCRQRLLALGSAGLQLHPEARELCPIDVSCLQLSSQA